MASVRSEASAIELASGRKWKWILGSIAAISVAIVPPVVSRMGNTVSARSGGIAIGEADGPVNIGNKTTNNFFVSWADGIKKIAGFDQAPAPVVPPSSIPIAEPITSAIRSDQPVELPIQSSSVIAFAYEDNVIGVLARKAFIFEDGTRTTTQLVVKNKTESDLLVAFDQNEDIVAFTNTGEQSSGTCRIGGVQSFRLTIGYVISQNDFSRLTPGASISLNVSCPFQLSKPSEVDDLTINLPLIRVEQDQVRRFTVNVDQIPTN